MHWKRNNFPASFAPLDLLVIVDHKESLDAQAFPVSMVILACQVDQENQGA